MSKSMKFENQSTKLTETSCATNDESVLKQSDNRKQVEILGFKTFLIVTKTITFLFYVVILILSNVYLTMPLFHTFLAVGITEFILIVLTVYHIIRPTLGVVLTIIGFELVLGLAKMVLALASDFSDGGKDCTRTQCNLLSITEAERFGLFWFCLSSALYDYFIALIVISYSPQMYEFEAGDEFLF